MNRDIRGVKGRKAGFSIPEFSLLLGLITLILVGLLGLLSTADDGSPYPDITPYRWANAMYARSQLEKVRVAVMTYYDQTGGLPGDSPHGNGNGRIEKEQGESARVFGDMRETGALPQPSVLIRGRQLELYYTTLRAEGRVLGEGHFFKLDHFDRLEAIALDRKYDDARSDAGDIIFSHNDDGTVDLYVRFALL